MHLSQLLEGISYLVTVSVNLDVDITDIVHDIDKITDNCCYIELHGVNRDIDAAFRDALDKGATIIVADAACRMRDDTLPIIYVGSAREAYAIMACNYYGNPSLELVMIGVVGTNGKTSCAKILSSMLNHLGQNTATIGTLGAEYNKQVCVTNMTTPDPMTLQKLLRDMARDMVKYVVMEVSAHAIFFKKTAGIIFGTLLFTNISQDHLDFFGTMQRYSSTKLSFFRKKHAQKCVLNCDDEYYPKLSHDTDLDAMTYSLCKKADVTATAISYKDDYMSFNLMYKGNTYQVQTALIGEFNVYNIIGCVGVMLRLGFDITKVLPTIRNIDSVPGRCNLVANDTVKYLIDYAHTPDSLQRALEMCKQLTKAKVLVVFGCGGDRDKSKRAIMGRIAKSFADIVVLTNDNPRNERPISIIEDILEGIDDRENVFVILNRRDAISLAKLLTDKNDVVLIAGKGAEDTMDINGEKLHFSDYITLKEILGAVDD